MTNGFGVNGAFGSFEPEPYYLGKMRLVTIDFNGKIVEFVDGFVKHDLLSSSEFSRETLLEKIADLEKSSELEYRLIFSVYRCDSRASNTPCHFTRTIEAPIGLDVSKCQLQQLDAVLATILDAILLSNKIKAHVGIIVGQNPQLKTHFIEFFNYMETCKVDDGETLESQLRRQIYVIDNPRLRAFFSVLLKELEPRLERRLLLYEDEGSTSFGSKQCLLCAARLDKTVHAPCPLPEEEKKITARMFYNSIFHKTFYSQLFEFVKLVK